MQTPRTFTLPRIFLFSTLLSLMLPASLVAQTTAARPDRGIMPGASYSVSDTENVSLTNGNVQLTIPLASLPPMAGGKLKYTVNAIYNSKLWNVTRQEQRLGQFYGCPSWVIDTPQLSDLGGWRVPYNYQIVFRNAHEDFDYDTPPPPPTADCINDAQEQTRLQSQYYRVILITPDGAEHELRPTDNYLPYGGSRSYLLNYYKDTPTTINGAMRYYSFDGSYLYAVINPSGSSTSWTVYMNDGTRIVQYSNGIQRITDTNGNNIKIFTDANGGHVQDELTGREIKITDTSVSYQTVTGIWQSVSLVRGSTQVQGKIYQVNDWSESGGELGGGVCTRNDLLAASVPVIREIVFPATEPGVTARKYTFSYNSDTTSSATDDWHLACGMPPQSYTRTVSNGMGELSQMTTPSGAVVNYSYSKSSIHNFSFDINDIPRSTVTQKQVVHDGITDTWTYNITEFGGCGGTVNGPDSSVTTEQCYAHDPAGAQFFGFATDKGGLSVRTRRSDKEVIERHWTMLPFTGANTNATGNFGGVSFNPVVDVEYTTILDDTPSHAPIKISAKKYQYDFNGNLIQQIDYDWFDPGLVTRDSDGIPVSVPAGATALRTTNYSHYNQAATASSTNVYAKRSLSTATPLILSAPQQTTLSSSIVQFSYDGQSYGVAPTVGNLTSKRVWDDLDNKWITTSNTYDVYGNVATATDGRGKTTQYFYDDATHARPNRVVVDPQNGTGTQTTTTAYDFATGLVTSVTDPNSAVSTIDYTNQLLGTIDPFGRPGVSIGPLVNAGGVNQHHRVTTTYEDHLLRFVVAADLNAENDKLVKTRTTGDMLGRTVLVEQTEDGTNYTLRSQQAYAQGGLITFSSSMMRTGVSSNTDSWTRVTNDLLGRPTEVSTFGGATQPPNTGTNASASGTVTTAYSANFTTVTDQAGKVRRSIVDALGRLIRVDEPDASNNLGTTAAPVQPTSYTYDVFGNLTTVTQGSQPQRNFTYDSLSRLRTALNPESGSIGYQYDDNGNLAVKTDARGVSSHFEYDSLNRITRRWYNGSTLVSSTTHNTPALPLGVGATDEAKFYYDTQTLSGTPPGYSRGVAVGRLVAQTYGAGTNGDYYTYDALGHATSKFQQIGTFNYQVTAVYNLSGALTGVTYPSGHTITNAYDQAGRLTTFSGNLGDNITRNYASGILYTPVGGPTWEQYGTSTSTYHKSFYNSRGQLFDTRVSSVNDTWDWNRGRLINYYSSNHAWGQSGTDNNGNLLFAETWIPPANATLDQADTLTEDSYTYDSLNRLTSVAEQRMSVAGGWGNWTQQFRQQYAYDRYGNRTIDGAQTWGTGINNKQFTVDTATNRLGVPGGQTGAMSYDTAGNLTNDTYTGAGNRTYDAENKITSALGGSNQTESYAYDAGGQRIKRTVDGVTTWQVYGFDGELLAEYPLNGPTTSPQKEYGYRNGQLLITAQCGLVGNWKLDENTGTTAADSSASNNSGTLTSGATWAVGNTGAAGSFDGVDDYVQVGAPSSLVMTTAVSLSAWIYPTGAGSNGTYGGTILIKEGEYVLARFPNGKIQWGFANSNPGWQFIDTGYTAALNQWTHIAVTYDNGTIKTYANGTLVNTYSGSGTIGDAIPAQNDFRIGGRQAISQNFQGRIDEVRVYNRALTATEVSSLVSAPTTTINWLVTDHLGTPRIILDQTGSFANVKRHDYLPFGEELFAPTGGRDSAHGYSGDGIRQQFTAKERDVETGLDYFGTRYFASTQGRFTGADAFFKDSVVADPQSWNKYAYVRNNPLKYVDPEGEKATVTIVTDEKNKTGTITIDATMAVYAMEGSNLSSQDVDQAANTIEQSIEKAWSGTYVQNGITYTVTTNVLVTVVANETQGEKSGAQNVIGLWNGQVSNTADSVVRPGRIFGGPDSGQWNVNHLGGGVAAHEFTHLLGVDDRKEGPYLSNTNLLNNSSIPKSATAYDYGWALGGAINSHRTESRPYLISPNSGETRGATPAPRLGSARDHKSTREIRAARVWWN